MGRTVECPIRPTSIELSQNETELKDPRAYPVKVCHPDVLTCWYIHLRRLRTQVCLQQLDAADERTSTEVVNARFVVGADG